ncbi:Gag polyprotein [Dissostichus eleginoides]|uniref:Gag polyprotein n=1 Tax=Dissostichus eleginoides TaxID=100907 RepID=A0AAD9C2K0_DISEL|nr:Gag polyprotein [Dissostichus eleginoides]
MATRANAANAANADLLEIKDALSSITKDISDLNKTRKDDSITIKELLETIGSMERIMKEKDEKIVVKGDSAPSTDRDRHDSVETQVLEALNDRGVYLKSEEIEFCHTLGKPSESGFQRVIIKLVSRKTKARMMINAKKLKGTGIYINEHLTKRNADIARTARDLRKRNKIEATWTRDCKIFIKTNEGKVSIMKDSEDLSIFL